jgi:lysophospholipase L1-like esterase
MANTSGYGDAFCARFNRANTCINLAKGGRSSGSFRAEGRWDEVEACCADAAAYRATYVLIQFGHNDQPGKPGRSTDLKTEFPVNMARYAQEVKRWAACRCWSRR